MELSRYIVHRASRPDPLPAVVQRRAVRELLLLAKLEEKRMADMGQERWLSIGFEACPPIGVGPWGRTALCGGFDASCASQSRP